MRRDRYEDRKDHQTARKGSADKRDKGKGGHISCAEWIVPERRHRFRQQRKARSAPLLYDRALPGGAGYAGIVSDGTDEYYILWADVWKSSSGEYMKVCMKKTEVSS